MFKDQVVAMVPECSDMTTQRQLLRNSYYGFKIEINRFDSSKTNLACLFHIPYKVMFLLRL